jgi:hypothetical protein
VLEQITGYRVSVTALGARLAVLRLGGPPTPLRDLTLLVPALGRAGTPALPAEVLARAILIHWLDREVPAELARRLALEFLASRLGVLGLMVGKDDGGSFLVSAAELRGFLAAQGVAP